ncbi:MAG TPA: hypothetical protein VLC98_05470 [Phnomibacter sp.]|nr:hypothetical protein [Phnomibacter sp.]
MKKLIVPMVAVCLAISSFAQTQLDAGASPHLSFKGVPMTGTINEFASQMKKNGLSYVNTTNGIAVFKGEMAGYKNCYVGVSNTKQKDIVYKVAVKFPDCDTWAALASNYFTVKEILTKKYGAATACVEAFKTYTPENDGFKLTQVAIGECTYYTTYHTEKGTIQLSIANDISTGSYVRLVYFDKINSEKIKELVINDL